MVADTAFEKNKSSAIRRCEGLTQGLKASLWEAADQQRANFNLTATEYAMPVLGLNCLMIRKWGV